MPIAVGYLASGLQEGSIARTGVTTDILSSVNGMSIILPFGRALIYAPGSTGTHEKTIVLLPNTAGQVIRGVSVLTDSISPQLDAFGREGFPPALVANSLLMPVVFGRMIKGYIAVQVVEAVLVGDVPTAIITVGANQGRFGKTPGATQIICPATWEYATAAAPNGIALILMK